MLRVGRENAWPVKCMYLKCFHVIKTCPLIVYNFVKNTQSHIHGCTFINLFSLVGKTYFLFALCWFICLHHEIPDSFFFVGIKKWFSYHTFINYLICFFSPAYLCVNKMLLLVHLAFSLMKMAIDFEMNKTIFSWLFLNFQIKCQIYYKQSDLFARTIWRRVIFFWPIICETYWVSLKDEWLISSVYVYVNLIFLILLYGDGSSFI